MATEESDRHFYIEVLLHEYDALRAEVVARASSRFQLLGFATAAAAVLGITKEVTNKGFWLWGILIALAVIAIVIWVVFRLYIHRCAGRLREIEKEINDELKEPALIWETHRLPLAQRQRPVVLWGIADAQKRWAAERGKEVARIKKSQNHASRTGH